MVLLDSRPDNIIYKGEAATAKVFRPTDTKKEKKVIAIDDEEPHGDHGDGTTSGRYGFGSEGDGTRAD